MLTLQLDQTTQPRWAQRLIWTLWVILTLLGFLLFQLLVPLFCNYGEARAFVSLRILSHTSNVFILLNKCLISTYNYFKDIQ